MSITAENFYGDCPLCGSPIKAYYINYDEGVRMCENVECIYPFGHKLVEYIPAAEIPIDYTADVYYRSSLISTCSQASTRKIASVKNEIEPPKNIAEHKKSLSEGVNSEVGSSLQADIEESTTYSSIDQSENIEDILNSDSDLAEYSSPVLPKPLKLKFAAGTTKISNPRLIAKLKSIGKAGFSPLLTEEELSLTENKPSILKVQIAPLTIDAPPMTLNVSIDNKM